MARGAVLRKPYRLTIAVLEWAVDEWLWIDGEATLSGVDLLELDGRRVMSVLTALIMRRVVMDQDQTKAMNRMKVEMLRSAETPVVVDPGQPITGDGMFGIRGGPVGTIGG